MADDRFKYHAPTDESRQLHEGVRNQIENLTLWMESMLPVCRETSLAKTKLEEAMFWANAAIAREISAKVETSDDG